MRAFFQQEVDQPPLALQVEAAIVVEGRQQYGINAFEVLALHGFRLPQKSLTVKPEISDFTTEVFCANLKPIRHFRFFKGPYHV